MSGGASERETDSPAWGGPGETGLRADGHAELRCLLALARP